MISMAGFHTCYDLAYLYGWKMPWFTQTVFAARTTQRCEKPAPSWAYANPLPALAGLGRHALPFYLLHQPIILGVLELVYSVR